MFRVYCCLLLFVIVIAFWLHIGYTPQEQGATTMAKIKLTTITEAAATNFIKKAKAREMLTCGNIPGFHLTRLANGGSWRYRYTTITGKRRTATVGSFPAMLPEVAATKVNQWVMEGNADPLQEKQERKAKAISTEEGRKHKTLGIYIEGRYSKVMETWPPRSAKLNKQRLELHFSNLLDTPMDEIKHRHIEEWQERQQKKGRAHSTIQRVYTALKALLRQAVQHKVIDADPLQGFSLNDPTFTEQQAIKGRNEDMSEKRRLLTDNEILALHDGLDAFAETIRQQRRNSRAHGKPFLQDLDALPLAHWFQPFCLLALHTGLRPGDIYTLTWQELNINFAMLKKITGKSARSIRKGKGGTLVEMKLNSTIHGIMKNWWEQSGKPATGLVFPSKVTGAEMAVTAHHKPWKAVKELGNLPENLNFYALRHHFISSLVAQGMPLLAVASLAGHRTTLMIEKHYGHLCERQAAQAVDIMARNIEQIRAKAVK